MKLSRPCALFFISWLAAAPLPGAPLKQPLPEPAWKLQDLDGHTVSADQLKGKVVVVDFWATWCVPCRKEIPGYIALQNKYGADGLVVIGVSTDDGGPKAVERVRRFIDVYNIQATKEGKPPLGYKIVMADGDVIAGFGGLDAIPTTFIVDRQGVIRDRKVGAVPPAVYEKTILGYLKGDRTSAGL